MPVARSSKTVGSIPNHFVSVLAFSWVLGALLPGLAHVVSDCETLAATGWASNAGWIVNTTNPSSWCCANHYGIMCDASGMRVVLLSLPGLQLSGSSLSFRPGGVRGLPDSGVGRLSCSQTAAVHWQLLR